MSSDQTGNSGAPGGDMFSMLGNSRTRGGVSGCRIPMDKVSGFFKKNSGKVTVSAGVFTREQCDGVVKAMIARVPDGEDIAQADYGDVFLSLMLIMVLHGGEDRAYENEREVALCVGEKSYVVALREVLAAVKEVDAGGTVRRFTRANSGVVLNLLETAEVKVRFAEAYGSVANLRVLRSDLMHKNYVHKFDDEVCKAERVKRLLDSSRAVSVGDESD